MANDPLLKRGVNRCVEPRACYLFPAPTRVRVRMRFREPWQHLASLCIDFDTTRHGRLAIAHRARCGVDDAHTRRLIQHEAPLDQWLNTTDC